MLAQWFDNATCLLCWWPDPTAHTQIEEKLPFLRFPPCPLNLRVQGPGNSPTIGPIQNSVMSVKETLGDMIKRFLEEKFRDL